MANQATLILHNANVLTMDDRRPHASAIAAGGDGHILAVGDDEVKSLRSLATRAIDCQGRTVVPGFVDAHCHILAYAAHLLSVDCSPNLVASIIDIQAVIRHRAAVTLPGQWIRAVGYDEADLAEGRHPTRWDLDAAAPDHPVRLIHRTGHACVLNSLALRLAGIDIATEEPPGGYMERDLASGEPTGLLLEMNDVVEWAMPHLPDDELARGVRLISQHLLSRGVTCVQDASVTNGPAEIALLRRLHSEGHLKQQLSMLAGLSGAKGKGQSEEGRESGALCSDVSGVKIMLRDVGGEIYPSVGELAAMIGHADAAGLPVAVHAVSEAAVAATVAAFERVLGHRQSGGLCHRIEHASECPPALVQRIARLGLTVVTQPSFLYHNGDRYLRAVEPQRLHYLYPLRSLLAAGVDVASGSDAPVAPADPLLGLYGAVTRRSRGGQPVVAEVEDSTRRAEAVSAEAALRMHTIAAARAIGQENTLGSIMPGKRADLVVLAADPRRLMAKGLLTLTVEMTILGGAILWSRGQSF